MIDISSILQIPPVQTPPQILPDAASFEAIWVNLQNAPAEVQPPLVAKSGSDQNTRRATADPSGTSAAFVVLPVQFAGIDATKEGDDYDDDIAASKGKTATQFDVLNVVIAVTPTKSEDTPVVPRQRTPANGIEILSIAKKTIPEKAVVSTRADVTQISAKEFGLEVTRPQAPIISTEYVRTPISVSAAAQAIPVAPHQLDLARDMMWLDNLAHEIAASASRDGHISFRLLPESLGQLDVGLTHGADGVHIQLDASTDAAAKIIAVEQPRLIDELRQYGVKVSGSELSSGQQHSSPKGQPAPRHEVTPPETSRELFKSNPNPKRNDRFA